MTKRIRITGPGIFGAISKDNPTGEIPVGSEFDINGDLPVGWKGRAVVVGEEPAEGSVAITNDDDERIESVRKEVIAEAQKHIDALKVEHAKVLEAETDRAVTAEKLAAERLERITVLEAEAAARGPDPELIKAAIDGLDPKNEDHWTAAGLPQVDAVKAALGADVTRAQIEAAAPEAKRPATT